MNPRLQQIQDITRQGTIFDWSQMFRVEDELLYACMASFTSLSCGTRLHGFSYAKNTAGYVLLASVVRQALGIHRLPFHEDRILAAKPDQEVRAELEALRSELTAERLARMSDAVLRLYEHTQAQLNAAGVGSIRLTRRVLDRGGRDPEGIWSCGIGRGDGVARYASNLVTSKRAASILGRKTVAVDMDLLNSFGEDDGYFHFPVRLVLDVPAQDVLYCRTLVAPPRERDSSPDFEEGEWVVVNRSADGVVHLPLEAIDVEPGSREVPEMANMSKEDALRWLERHEPAPIRTGVGSESPRGIASFATFRLGWEARLRFAWKCLRGEPP